MDLSQWRLSSALTEDAWFQCILETAVSSAYETWSLHVRLLLKLPVNGFIGRLRSNTFCKGRLVFEPPGDKNSGTPCRTRCRRGNSSNFFADVRSQTHSASRFEPQTSCLPLQAHSSIAGTSEQSALDHCVMVTGIAGLLRPKKIPRLDPSACALECILRIRLKHQALTGTEPTNIHQRVISLR